MIGEEAEIKKLRTLSLSDNTVQRRITDMTEDIKCQVLENIKKKSPIFALRLDESTDVASCAQVMVYVRYVHECDFKNEFLLCSPMELFKL